MLLTINESIASSFFVLKPLLKVMQLGLSSCKLSGLLWEYALGITISKNANKEILKYLLIGERTIKGD